MPVNPNHKEFLSTISVDKKEALLAAYYDQLHVAEGIEWTLVSDPRSTRLREQLEWKIRALQRELGKQILELDEPMKLAAFERRMQDARRILRRDLRIARDKAKAPMHKPVPQWARAQSMKKAKKSFSRVQRMPR